MEGTVFFNIDITGDGYDPTVEGYRDFLQEMQNYGEKYKGMQRVVALVSQELGYLPRAGIDILSDKVEDMSKQLTNFTVADNTEYVGDELRSYTGSQMLEKIVTIKL